MLGLAGNVLHMARMHAWLRPTCIHSLLQVEGLRSRIWLASAAWA